MEKKLRPQLPPPKYSTPAKFAKRRNLLKESPPVTSRTPLFSIAQPSPPLLLLLAESQSLKKVLLFPGLVSYGGGESNINQITSCTRTSPPPPSPFLSPSSSSVWLLILWATRLSLPSNLLLLEKREEEAQVFREWGMKPRVVDVDLVNIALSAIFSRKRREGERKDRRKKNGYSVIHVGRGVRIEKDRHERGEKKRDETINRLVREGWRIGTS